MQLADPWSQKETENDIAVAVAIIKERKDDDALEEGRRISDAKRQHCGTGTIATRSYAAR